MTFSATSKSVKFDPFAEEHDHLRDILEQIQLQLDDRSIPRHDILVAFSELHREALEHFVHEEQFDGFFDNIIDQAPRLHTSAKRLIAEHMRFLGDLQTMQDIVARSPANRWREWVATQYATFVQRFCQHEQAETELMHEAFYQDIGAED